MSKILGKRMCSPLAISCLCAGVFVNTLSMAADHQEAPSATALLAADIGDYFAWHSDDNVSLVVTFGTFASPGNPPAYDPTILYEFHFDSTVPADGVADVTINARFAQDSAGNWGIQVIGPADQVTAGAVDTILESDGMRVWAGLADDPFFFDQSGFQQTVSTGTLSFNPESDDVAGLNVTAIVVELPIDALLPGGGSFQTWATTGSL